ncbi:MAG: hypothetical protein LKI85_13070 [Enterobacter sp.]|jgi:hypothetical protein|nr:hypothetical protein [Enterobacter sp.]
MTNTQNVTELQPRMTREQLIDAARTAAKFLPVASAQLMNELANRLDYTSVALCEAMAQRKELAKENSTIKFGVQSIKDSFHSGSNEDISEAIKDALNLPCTATNAVAREMAADNIQSAIDLITSLLNHQASGVAAVLNILQNHSDNLRAGAVVNG